MSISNRKKVVLRLSTQLLLAGFADPVALRRGQRMELLEPEGQLVQLAPEQWLAAYFVSEFTAAAALAHAVVRGAPRRPGLHVRCRILGHYSVEGILASDLLALDAGLDLHPLQDGCGWQRIYIPRRALVELTAVDLVRPARRRGMAIPTAQFGLFSPPEPPQELT